jgi:hypothetical protein
MLYLAPLFHMGRPQARFGYADDIAILAISSSLDHNCKKLQANLKEALEWGLAEGITFDPSKSKLLHFTQKHKIDVHSLPGVTSGTHTIQAATGSVRWLGVYFDRTLRFRHHVQVLAEKALQVGNALRSLGKTTRGVSPILLQQVVTACVLRVCYFAAESWWPGRSYTRGTVRKSTQVESHLRLFEKVTYSGARAILPVYCTTPTAVLLKEANILPAEIELERLSQAAAVRTTRLDPRHPLRKRAE